MKTIFSNKVIIAAIIFVLSIVSCTKERIETELTSYESLNDYYDSKKQVEQEYIIDSLGSCPLTGLLGTRICINKSNLQLPGGDSVYFPYTLKLVELYTPKDMIYYSILNNSNTGNFYCKGEVRIRTFKNDTELTLRNQSYIDVEIKDTLSNESLQIFNENTPNPFEWKGTSDLYADTDYGYEGFITSFGWNAAGKSLLFDEPATITFTSETDNLETVQMYVYLPNHKSLYEVTNHSSVQIPIGETAKIIMIAIDSNDKLYHFFAEQPFQGNATIPVSLTEISDAGLTQILDEL